MIKKAKSGYVIIHCQGKKKGSRIPATRKPVSKQKALSIHKAIIISKTKRGKM